MKVVMPDGTPFEEVMTRWDEELKKKNLANWLRNKFPNGWFGYAPMYIITHPWLIARHVRLAIKHAWQRVFRGWDDTAVWSIDYYLSKIIPEMVQELKDIDFGIPCAMFEGLPVENTDNMSYSKESEEIARKRWFDILDTIIEGFKIYHENKDSCFERLDMQDSEEVQKFKKAFALLQEYFGNLWW